MKRVVALGLLILLLYNMLGLTTAILLFDEQFKSPTSFASDDDYQLLKVYVPSLPYSEDWENSEGVEGLTKKNGNFYNTTHVLHANDTLYVTLKSNQTARERFLDLANEIQSLSDQRKHTNNTTGKAIKILDNLLKIYVQNVYRFTIHEAQFSPLESVAVYSSKEIKANNFLNKFPTPPPEHS